MCNGKFLSNLHLIHVKMLHSGASGLFFSGHQKEVTLLFLLFLKPFDMSVSFESRFNQIDGITSDSHNTTIPLLVMHLTGV